MKTALVLLQTPFQASVTPSVLAAEGIGEFDLIYFTQHDATEDRHYFNRLARAADKAVYCHAPVRRFDVLGYLDFLRQSWRWVSDKKRDLTILSSIDNYIFSAIARRQRSADLVGLDDGTANIFGSSIYHHDIVGARGRLYRRLLDSYDLDNIKARIVRHYTFHPQFKNIVPPSRLRQIVWPGKWEENYNENGAGPPVTFFIGGPFGQLLSSEQIDKLTAYVSQTSVDYYVRHPRETLPLDIGAPILDKQGFVAEDAMIKVANGRPIQVIGGFSSVMFNIGNRAALKSMLLLKDVPESEKQGRLAVSAGCRVVFL